MGRERFQSRDGFRPGQSIELLSTGRASRAAHHEIIGRLRRSNGSRLATYAIDVIATSAHSVGVSDFSNLIESFSSIENISFEWKKEQWSIQVGILACRGWVILGCPQPPVLDSLRFSRLNNLCRAVHEVPSRRSFFFDSSEAGDVCN